MCLVVSESRQHGAGEVPRSRPEDNVSREIGRTPSPPIKSFDFRGFDSSRLLILKGGNSHVPINLYGVSRKV